MKPPKLRSKQSLFENSARKVCPEPEKIVIFGGGLSYFKPSVLKSIMQKTKTKI
jgi:hypothetical protein